MRQRSASSPGSSQSGKASAPRTCAPSNSGVVSNTQRKNHRLAPTSHSPRSSRPSIQAPSSWMRRLWRCAPCLAAPARRGRRPAPVILGSASRGRRPMRAMSPCRQARSSTCSTAAAARSARGVVGGSVARLAVMRRRPRSAAPAQPGAMDLDSACSVSGASLRWRGFWNSGLLRWGGITTITGRAAAFTALPRREGRNDPPYCALLERLGSAAGAVARLRRGGASCRPRTPGSCC